MRESSKPENPFYGEAAEEYDAVMADNRLDVKIRQDFQHLVIGEISSDQLIVDFGGGTGTDARYYAENGYSVHVHDASSSMLAVARRKLRALADAGQVSFSGGNGPDCTNMPEIPGHDSRPVSVVANFAVLNLLPDPARDLRELGRLVSPGGCFIGSILNPWRKRHWRPHNWVRLAPLLLPRGCAPLPGDSYNAHLLRPGAVRRWLGNRFHAVALPPEAGNPDPGGGRNFIFLLFRKQPANA